LVRIDGRDELRLREALPALALLSEAGAAEESQERREFPSTTPDSPPEVRDAAGRRGEAQITDYNDSHTAHKAGSRSVAQKEAESKYADRSHPASHKVAGAFGEEPEEKLTDEP
jgi:hypothetical protein